MNLATATVSDPYWSRSGNEWTIANREDPVLWQESATRGRAAWSPEELAGYDQQGFCSVDPLLSSTEAKDLLFEAKSLAASADTNRPDVIAEPGSDIVRSLFRIHETNGAFRAIACDPRLIDRARQILGGDVYIHQSRINFKPAFDGKEFFWHSDFETWHIEDGMPRMRAVSVSISLTDNNEFNGPLMLVPGSHRSYVRCVGETPENHFQQSLKKQQYGVPDREALQQLVDDGGIVAPKGQPGSAVFFDCNTMHGSSGNLSPFPRTNLFIVYNSVENQLQDPFGGTEPRPDFLASRTCVPVV
jgi:ectoine hydroxylase